MKLLFIDTETTGIDPVKNGIIQIAGIIEIDGKVIEEFNFHCKPLPGKTYTSEALDITGKTIEEIKKFPDTKEIYSKLMKILEKYINRYDKNDKFYLVGQNVKFDYDFINQWFKDNGNKYFYAYIFYHLIDIISISTIFSICGIINVKNMKLKTIAEYFGIEFKAHDSMEDIQVSRKIFYKFVDTLNKNKK